MKQEIETMSTEQVLDLAMEKAKAEPAWREMSNAIMKMEEAMLWITQYRKKMATMAQQSGVGFYGDISKR